LVFIEEQHLKRNRNLWVCPRYGDNFTDREKYKKITPKHGGFKTSLQWGILLEPKILYEILGGHLSQIFE